MPTIKVYAKGKQFIREIEDIDELEHLDQDAFRLRIVGETYAKWINLSGYNTDNPLGLANLKWKVFCEMGTAKFHDNGGIR